MRTAAGVFEAAASSIALTDAHDWRARLSVGLGRGRARDRRRPAPAGYRHRRRRDRERRGPGGAATAASDPRFAAQIAAGTGYVPRTMVVVPLMRAGQPIGVLSVLDRRDGGFYSSSDARARTDVRRARRDGAGRAARLLHEPRPGRASVAQRPAGASLSDVPWRSSSCPACTVTFFLQPEVAHDHRAALDRGERAVAAVRDVQIVPRTVAELLRPVVRKRPLALDRSRLI